MHTLGVARILYDWIISSFHTFVNLYEADLGFSMAPRLSDRQSVYLHFSLRSIVQNRIKEFLLYAKPPSQVPIWSNSKAFIEYKIIDFIFFPVVSIRIICDESALHNLYGYNLFHRMLIPLYAKRERPQARPLSFAVLKIFAQTSL